MNLVVFSVCGYISRSSKLITGRLKKAVPKDFIAYARSLIPKVGLSNSEVKDHVDQLFEVLIFFRAEIGNWPFPSQITCMAN